MHFFFCRNRTSIPEGVQLNDVLRKQTWQDSVALGHRPCYLGQKKDRARGRGGSLKGYNMRTIWSTAWATPNVDRVVFPIPRSWKTEGADRNLGYSMSTCMNLTQTSQIWRKTGKWQHCRLPHPHMQLKKSCKASTRHTKKSPTWEKQNQIGQVMNGTRLKRGFSHRCQSHNKWTGVQTKTPHCLQWEECAGWKNAGKTTKQIHQQTHMEHPPFAHTHTLLSYPGLFKSEQEKKTCIWTHGTYQASVYICFCRNWHRWSFRGSEWHVEFKMPITCWLFPTYCY